MMQVRQAVDRLIRRHGGVRKAARAMGISASSLSRVKNGLLNASPKVLRALGIERRVTFHPRQKKHRTEARL